ncbi:MAG: XdhC/CoxI family protein [Dehalococcoidia bacterium]
MTEPRTDVTLEIVREVLVAARGGPSVATATMIRAPDGGRVPLGAKLLVRADGTRLGSLGGGPLEGEVARDALAALTERPRQATAQSLYYGADGQRLRRPETGPEGYQVLVEVTEAVATLLVVGGGHIGQALAEIGALVGFAVAVVDDRPEFASPERFPQAERVICGDFEEELRRFPITPQTYVVVVTRGHREDELSLRQVVTSEAAYVGMIGSRRRSAMVLRHLGEEGYPREALERVRTPIGLDIGAETPEEIAVSIMAEIIQVRRGGSGRPMREQRAGGKG